MTRGYVCCVKGNKIESVAYLQSDAYIDGYGLEILNAITENSLDEWMEKQIAYNHECYGDEEPNKHFALNWIRPDKESRIYSDWNYMEYGYIYDVNKGILKVYYTGKLLFTITPEEYDKYRYIFENEYAIYQGMAYNPGKMSNDGFFSDYIKKAAKEPIEVIKNYVEASKAERVYLDDYHCVANGHRPGHEVYQKELYSTESQYRLKFLVEHDTFFDTNYGWNVLLQTPFCRVKAVSGPYKYGSFRSEKLAVDAIRIIVEEIGVDKMIRAAEIFNLYETKKDQIEDGTFEEFLSSLDKEWKKHPWFAPGNCCDADAIKREGYARIRRMQEEKENRECTSA